MKFFLKKSNFINYFLKKNNKKKNKDQIFK